MDLDDLEKELQETTRLIEQKKAELREKKEQLYSTLIRGGISHGVLTLRHQQNTAPHEEANSPYGLYFQPTCRQRGVWQW